MKGHHDPTEADWSLVTNLEAVAALSRGAAAKDLREESITPGGITLLELALLQPGATSSALAGLLGISRQATSKAVQGLAEQGLLETKAHPEDARAQRIMVTAAGKRALQRSRAKRAASVEHLLEPLGPKDRALLAELLEKLRVAARPGLQRAADDGTPGTSAPALDAPH